MSQNQFTHTANISPQDIHARPLGSEELGEKVVILAGDATATAALLAGTVMGKVTASGDYVPYSDVAVDGSEVAAGILSQTFSTTDQYVTDSAGAKTAKRTPATIYQKGTYFEAACPGIDAAGKVDLASGISFQ